jgi:hypothetical protein
MLVRRQRVVLFALTVSNAVLSKHELGQDFTYGHAYCPIPASPLRHHHTAN